MSISMKQVFDSIVNSLSEENFLSDYTYRRSKFAFTKKIEDGEISVVLDHWYYTGYSVVIAPFFDVKYKVLIKWFASHTFKRKSDYASTSSLRRVISSFSNEHNFDFDIDDTDNWTKIYESMRDAIMQGLKTLEEKYSSIEKWYNADLRQYLDEDKKYEGRTFDRDIQVLTAARIVDPENYPKFRTIILNRFDEMMYKQEYGPNGNYEPYKDKLDEILADLESIDFNKLRSKKKPK